jgi:hypothetical protein
VTIRQATRNTSGISDSACNRWSRFRWATAAEEGTPTLLTGVGSKSLRSDIRVCTLLAEVRAEKGNELDGAFTRIIHEATDQLMDRLKNGDPVLVAGQIKRKPVSARDLALVSAITYDKRALARNQTPGTPETHLSLPELSDALKEYARQKRERDLAQAGLSPQSGAVGVGQGQGRSK